MLVARHGKDRASFARKIELDLDIWKGKAILSSHAGAHSYAVAQAIEAVHDLTNGKDSGLFLFIDRKGGAEVLPCSVTWLDDLAAPSRNAFRVQEFPRFLTYTGLGTAITAVRFFF